VTERSPESRAVRDLLSAGAAWSDATDALPIDVDALQQSIAQHFTHTLGREIDHAAAHYLYVAVGMVVRDRLMDRWRATRAATERQVKRRTCYLSLEYLMGRTLGNAAQNIELNGALSEALHALGVSVEDIESLETDAGLGNGGLGRLAACFLDSCATLGLPVIGYGLRYRYGMFRQAIDHGYQVEHPDNWLRNGNLWELERPERCRRVAFGGHVEVTPTQKGEDIRRWVNTDDVLAIPYDMPIPGYANGVVNTLRLWAATATDEFNLSEFNAGGYPESVAAKNAAENISMVLYPNDSSENGKVLRLRQQYFLVSASLQDVLADWQRDHDRLDSFAAAHCFQLNDTHPSLAVAELMRLCVDEHQLSWVEAWKITTDTMAYTNHTLLPEALECWPLDMITALLPRPMEIIHEINRRFLDDVEARWPGDHERRAAMSIVSFDVQPVVRMAHLAIVGSFSVNGVAQLHSNLLQSGLFHPFYELWPHRFNNKTNGVTQRRWLMHCNPELRDLLDQYVSEEWRSDFSRIAELGGCAHDTALQAAWRDTKFHNKQKLAELIAKRTGIDVPPHFMFDVQVKRMHEYKRQLLCLLHVVHRYLAIISGNTDMAPRMVLIAGKAAPGYEMAKNVIKLINNVADVINNDSRTTGRLRLVFLPDYNVSAMEVICPAADLSEQISTAGKEASGTGNMKFMMNGALTIGTLDGANVEILEAVGEAHFFQFGLQVNEVENMRRDYNPSRVIAADSRVAAIIQAFSEGMFDRDNKSIAQAVISACCSPYDAWLTIADLPAYLDAQDRVDLHWSNREAWTRSSILNTASSGRFSTDRTMRDYNEDIWHLTPLSALE